MSYDRITNLLECIKETEQKLITEFLEKLEVINRNYKGLIQPIVELIEEYKKRLKV